MPGKSGGSSAFVSDSLIEGLRTRIRGDVVGQGDQRYEASRKVFNAMIDRHPALVVRCAAAADVMYGVTFARENGLVLSVKSGGHSVAGTAVCDGGLMLDLSGMKGIRVDPRRRVVNAQPGLTLGEFDRETQAFGFAAPLGIVSATGIAGLTLGGGIGWLNGRYGLACDNVVSADVVTADGRLRTVSDSEDEDLHWAIRGGSGNFGVVTSFTYALHPVDTVLGGPVIYPVAQARDILPHYHRIASVCPDELSTAALFTSAPDGSLVLAIVVCWSGPADAGTAAVSPFRSLATPVADSVQPIPYVALQCMFDGAFPPGRLHYWKSGFLKNLSVEAITVMDRFAAARPSPMTAVGLQQLHGAAARVRPDATAFPHRDSHYDFIILAQWDDPRDTTTNVDWAVSFFEAMRPFLNSGVYVNDLGQEGGERVRAAYGTNYDRLAAIKAKYDPNNLFRMNHNIAPAAA